MSYNIFYIATELFMSKENTISAGLGIGGNEAKDGPKIDPTQEIRKFSRAWFRVDTQVEKWKQGETSRPPKREMIFLRRGSRLWNS